jgi:signal transduction histidine kinase
MSRHASRVPIHVWFGVALVVIATVPILAAWGTYALQTMQQQERDQSVRDNVTLARAFLVADVTRWADPTWKSRARGRLAAWGLQVQLVNAQGHPVFATTQHVPSGWNGEKLSVSKPRDKSAFVGGGVIFYPRPESQSWEGPLIAALAALLVTLAITAWVLGRTVVRPLAAASRAARGITAGNLDVRLPRSQVREVAEVAAALESMSAGLRDAIDRQEAIEQERRLFIGAIAHDLRTPLFTLRSYLSGLKDGLATTPEKAARYIEVCQDKADALERLITDLFTFARLEYLEQAPQLEPVDWAGLLSEAIEDMRPVASEKGIAVLLDGPSERCPLVGDPHLLARALNNLLDNALRHTPEGGEVLVRWRQADEAVVFAVEDSGSGIDPRDLPHVFMPLYRADSSRNRQTGGAGLGLAIAQRILRTHGGDLVAGNGSTGGAIFTGRIPVQSQVGPPLSALSS